MIRVRLDVMMEAEAEVMHCEGRERGHEPRNVGGLQKLSWQGNRFFPGASRRNIALDFSLVRLISDFSPPEH